jgi:two-component system LytT family response regulator
MQLNIRQLSIVTSDGLFFFSPQEVVRLEAKSNYTTIYFTNKKKILAAKVLKEFVQMLEPLGFVRIHRTHLVNRQHILCITTEGSVIMRDSSVAAISRRMKKGVMETLRNAA